ncbi:hypothetical protein FHS43_002461 [Streptosporangium becharense]|uniref:Uncharacterized protein n=1 Tax=Streptosporangium becharense TaxID=1816182 RepID=A0A7W9IJJ0_9ACTN|nr:hypothetical protein [Streptosporangium becharense]MBB2911196.1 hypothetical protein [Streptosporangium becharense]MBB5821746.1 hypothetical protein [Streptosporangium becharense]
MLAQGAKGAEISQTLSFVIATVAMLIAVLFRPREPQPHVRGWRLSLALSIAIALSLGLGLATTWWFLFHKPDLRVTDLVGVSGGRDMRDGNQAVLHVPGRPPARENLALTLTLVNQGPTGNCVLPAALDVVPVIDGGRGTPVETRSGREIRLPLTGAERQALLLVTLSVNDPACELTLDVSEAVLYN